MPSLLPRLRRGEITATAFFTATVQDCERLCRALLQSKRLRWFGERHLDDIVNYFRFELWRAIAQWDPSRGATLATFAIVRANTRTSGMVDRLYRKELRRGAHEFSADDNEDRESLVERVPAPYGVEATYAAKETADRLRAVLPTVDGGFEDVLFDLDADLILRGAARCAEVHRRAVERARERKMAGVKEQKRR